MIIPVGDEIKQPEIWKPITEEMVPNIAPIFEISNWGRVHNIETGNYLPLNLDINPDKYISIRLKSKDQKPLFAQCHRLVLMAFDKMPEYIDMEPDHIDCIKHHNWIWNLKWVSHNENMKLARYQTDSFKLGEVRKNSKLSNEDARIICEMIDKGLTAKQIAKKFIKRDCNIEKIANNIRLGLSWSFIAKDYDFYNKSDSSNKGSTTIKRKIITPIEICK